MYQSFIKCQRSHFSFRSQHHVILSDIMILSDFSWKSWNLHNESDIMIQSDFPTGNPGFTFLFRSDIPSSFQPHQNIHLFCIYSCTKSRLQRALLSLQRLDVLSSTAKPGITLSFYFSRSRKAFYRKVLRQRVTPSPQPRSTWIRPKNLSGWQEMWDEVSTSNSGPRNGVCVLRRKERGCRRGRGGQTVIHTWVSTLIS